MQRPEPVLFLLSRVLGGKTFSGQLMKVLESMRHIRPHFVLLEEEDYYRYRDNVPMFNRMAGLFVAPAILKWKLAQAPPPRCRTIFVQSFELMPACLGLEAACPGILAHDSTNIMSYSLLRNQHPGPLSAFEYWIKGLVTSPVYRRALARVRAFLPRSNWCASSLIADYGVDPENIIVTPSGLDVDFWSPPALRPARDLPVLLFVGNDFNRKGGPFLLDLFRTHLHPHARLRVISNDPILKGGAWPPGVEHIAGLGHDNQQAVVEAYRSADVFVFPTRKDQMGMVLPEAAATGLPIVASKVGGVGDVVKNGENGYLMEYDASAAEWAGAVLDLVQDRGKRLRYGEKSRAIAVSHFSETVLKRRIEAAFELVERDQLLHF